jgi:hypothetical protein
MLHREASESYSGRLSTADKECTSRFALVANDIARRKHAMISFSPDSWMPHTLKFSTSHQYPASTTRFENLTVRTGKCDGVAGLTAPGSMHPAQAIRQCLKFGSSPSISHDCYLSANSQPSFNDRFGAGTDCRCEPWKMCAIFSMDGVYVPS